MTDPRTAATDPDRSFDPAGPDPTGLGIAVAVPGSPAVEVAPEWSDDELDGDSRPPTGGMSGTVANGASWSAIGRLGIQAIQFVAGLALSRLLTPADFGLLASVYVITTFSQLFFELGLTAALVEIRDRRPEDESTVFWINALGGVVFALLITAAGPLIADLFNQPRLTELAPLVALPFMLSINVVQTARLQRSLRFKLIITVEVATSLIGTAVMVAAAFAGFGVYALTFGPIVQALSMSVIMFVVLPWKPTGFISTSSVRRLSRFSGGQLGTNVLNYWGRNADNLLIGKYLGSADLGYYNRGYNLMLLPVQQVTQVFGRVLFPALSAISSDHERVARGYRRTLRLINVASIPVLLGLAAVAPGLVPLLWGHQWTSTVILLQILCFAGIPQCVAGSVGWLFQSQGATGKMFKVGLATFAPGILALVIGLHWGSEGVAIGVLVRSWLSVIPTLSYACRLIELRALVVVRDSLPTVLTAGALFAAVWFVPQLTGWSRFAPSTVGAQVLLGVVIYVGGTMIFQRPLVAEIVGLVRRRAATASV
jgi:O-antigen/teichoic acid export membrane protein